MDRASCRLASLRAEREIGCQTTTRRRTRGKKKTRRRIGAALGSSSRSKFKRLELAGHLFARSSFLVLFLWWLHSSEVACLRIGSLEVPPAIWNGSETTLACLYELAPKDQLYSIKWYKDYVEFYRFQPAAQEQPGATGPPEPALNLNYAISAPPPSSKHEFELEGINLDLSKSNATHVHLRAVSLQSEAIFKCEISADSPTFATVSAERQMKVYVLPKQKLSLAAEPAGQPPAPVQPVQGQLGPAQAQQQPNVFQLNDLINFTCASGASRPAARLVWLLNDLPLGSFSATPQSELAQVTHLQIAAPGRAQLLESRSSLALRLQAGHLRQLQQATMVGRAAAARGRHKRANPTLAGYLPLKLTCLAQMAVEFSSESSILISSGAGESQASTSKRKRSRHRAASSLGWQRARGSDEDQEEAPNTRRRLGPDADEETSRVDDQEAQREPSAYRWPPGPARTGQHLRLRPDGLDAAWVSPSSLAATPGGGEGNYGNFNDQTARRQANPRQFVVWTSRQLRAQSEHIEQLLRRSGANQLEAPHIEARAISGGTQPGVDEANSEPEPEDLAGSLGEGDLLVEGPPEPPTPQVGNSNANYELNERVNFTCYHRRDELARGGAGELLDVRLRWFLNERELEGDFVNAFDGNKFYEAAGAPSTTNSRPGNSTRRDARGGDRPNRWTGNARSLVIEFTPSLFQLKELSLRCKSVVEQPLIEFEQSQVLHLATSPFIQVPQPSANGPQGDPQQSSVPGNRPSLYQTKHRQQQAGPSGVNPNLRPRGNVIRMRQSGRPSVGSSGATQATSFAHLVLTSCALSLLMIGLLGSLGDALAWHLCDHQNK